jgi:acetyltransferase-like isoleucine patch superfamily enzyme
MEILHSLKVRILQLIALFIPGATSTRVTLHRWRGVHIGRDVFISTAAMIETDMPELVWIGNRVVLGIRSTIIAHFHGSTDAEQPNGKGTFSVRIEDDAFIGPGVIILPGVSIGAGAVVTAGSVVTGSVAPLTMVQGNPARPVARCGIPLKSGRTAVREFYRQLQPIRVRPTGVAEDSIQSGT